MPLQTSANVLAASPELAFFTCFMLPILLAFCVLWLWALIDCVNREFKGPNDKLMWALIIVLLNGLGAILYFIIGRQQGQRPGEDDIYRPR